MKKTILAIICTLFCVGAVAQKSYTIKGTVPAENNGKQVYLYDYNAEKRIDSTTVADGAYVLKNSVATPMICRLAIADTRTSNDVIVDNYDITANFDDNGVFSIKADQGLNARYAKVVDRYAYLDGSVRQIIDSLTKIYGEDQEKMGEAFAPLVEPMVDELLGLYETEMLANKDNAYGVYCAWKLSEQKAENIEQLDSIMAIIPISKDFAPLKKQREQFQLIEKTGPGAMFKDFDAKTVDGKATKLSDYVGKGKYVLVDFWASWCGPCMREVPNLKYIHETYPDLMVLGVNVWDKHDKFLEAITKEAMTWNCIYASDDNTATELYGIQGIPTIILFAPDGKIVDRTLRGEEMKAYIAELFKK